ncbi:MAG TPA: H-X9-DG-CTERM domain-containing protein [Tepidisphaeraceae bacterium]|nr:H-X9-DG-CTERM domain-containing protein [Tepidisphaeraceae bacterium]
MQIACASNERQIAIACLAYVADNRGVLPIPFSGFENSSNPNAAIKPFQAIYLADWGMIDWEQGTLWANIPGGEYARRRLFNCPREGIELHPYIEPNNVVAGYANFSYMFSAEMCLWSGTPGVDANFGLQMSRIHHADHKMILMEPWGPGSIEGMPVSFSPTLTHRHSGKANVAFADSHVELLAPEVFAASATGIGTPAMDHYFDFMSDD